MDIILDDLTLKAKKKLFTSIMQISKLVVEDSYSDTEYAEENLDWILGQLLDVMDAGDGYDFWGSEGWKERL